MNLKLLTIYVLGVFFAISCQKKSPQSITETKTHSNYYPSEVINIIDKIDMQIIDDVEMDKNKAFGCNGVPYAYNVSMSADSINGLVPGSILFWCKNAKDKYLIYAEDDFSNNNEISYKVVDSISTERLLGFKYDLEGSFCLIPYNGVLGVNKDLSSFYYLDNRNKRGPSGIYPTLENGFTPVIITQESSTTVLYYYKKKWFIYIESDI